jgi:hypothetical protein
MLMCPCFFCAEQLLICLWMNGLCELMLVEFLFCSLVWGFLCFSTLL